MAARRIGQRDEFWSRFYARAARRDRLTSALACANKLLAVVNKHLQGAAPNLPPTPAKLTPKNQWVCERGVELTRSAPEEVPLWGHFVWPPYGGNREAKTF
jgi:hypothetical protein